MFKFIHREKIIKVFYNNEYKGKIVLHPDGYQYWEMGYYKYRKHMTLDSFPTIKQAKEFAQDRIEYQEISDKNFDLMKCLNSDARRFLQWFKNEPVSIRRLLPPHEQIAETFYKQGFLRKIKYRGEVAYQLYDHIKITYEATTSTFKSYMSSGERLKMSKLFQSVNNKLTE